jgi:hypothetical protein
VLGWFRCCRFWRVLAGSNADIRRLAFIRHAREIGFELSDVRSLLDLADHPEQSCAEVAAIARRHLNAVQERILQLNRLRSELARIVRSSGRGQSADQCNLIEALMGSECSAHQRGRKRVAGVPRAGTGGYAAPQQATLCHARRVGREGRKRELGFDRSGAAEAGTCAAQAQATQQRRLVSGNTGSFALTVQRNTAGPFIDRFRSAAPPR